MKKGALLILFVLVLVINIVYGTCSFSYIDTSGEGGAYNSIAVDSSGIPHISYQYFDSTNLRLKYAKYFGPGGDCGTGNKWNCYNIDIAQSGISSTSIALYSDKPQISYVSSGSSGQKLKYAKLTIGTTWTKEIVDDSTANVGDTSIAIDSSGNPHISYYYKTDIYFVDQLDLYYAKKTGTSWSISKVDSIGDVGIYNSIAVDSSGIPHIAYYDFTNKDLKYAKKTGTSWSITTLDSSGNVGLYPSIAVDYSGYPHIVYYNGIGTLKYIKWTGSAWTTPQVVSTGTATSSYGYYSKILFDSYGNPVVLYNNNGNILSYTKLIGTTWTSETITTSCACVNGFSMALDSNDIPHVSYFYQIEKNPRYSKCECFGDICNPLNNKKKCSDCTYVDVSSVPEICDGIDNDCDGTVDGISVCNDNNNCGTFGNVCTAGQTCVSGVCTAPCTSSWECNPSGSCVDGVQPQTCTDQNSCSIPTNIPPSNQPCDCSNICSGNTALENCVADTQCNCYYAGTCKSCTEGGPTCLTFNSQAYCEGNKCGLTCAWNANTNLCVYAADCAGQGGDTDLDTICDDNDNCPPIPDNLDGWYNPDQIDSNDDHIGDVCDPDSGCKTLSSDKLYCIEFSGDDTLTCEKQGGTAICGQDQECYGGYFVTSSDSSSGRCCKVGHCAVKEVLLTGVTNYNVEEGPCLNPNEEGIGTKMVVKWKLTASGPEQDGNPYEIECTIFPSETVPFYSLISVIITISILISYYLIRILPSKRNKHKIS